MDSGPSIFVLTLSTYAMIYQMFNVYNHDQLDKSKTMSIENQSGILTY